MYETSSDQKKTCAFIKKMLSSKPIERPSAHIILNSQLFMTKDQVIEQLQKLLEGKKKEIHTLKNVIAEKDEQLKDKEMIITKFKEILK
ncbi:eukaryotic translation initiation factor 2-alpha kinase 1-like isoform X1 [Brachionus plicatilis]|uniref:Eukaryotic translation initiation factor 2-alpha kinase 1-like isoform X1 n=1 Tax=Brachionus plicatilis TaxID=10195 RepID=A0A3M7S0L1_BRAPC|nr:eukaryotic translation initiation factor 2-alpha kinase 1-like isoform X1 [Brachionus plicatilis]